MKKEIQKKLLEFINIQKTVTTLELCDKFHLSESSCRRELHRLEDLNLIKRYHGGVNSLEKLGENESIKMRFTLEESKKESIAKEAAKLIQPESTIILLGGTTVFRMCKHIKQMKLTVITNSIIVFHELYNQKNIHMILLGGEYKKDEAELSGVLTITNSKVFVCDHVFMSVSGYVKNTGFTTTDPASVELYTWCMRLSNQVNLLCDSSKFENKGKIITASLGDIDYLITDEDIGDWAKQSLLQKDVRMIISKL